jgi:penicillin-binding protein 1C
MRSIKYFLLFLFLLFVKLGDFVSSLVTTVATELVSLLKRLVTLPLRQRIHVPFRLPRRAYYRMRKKAKRPVRHKPASPEANRLKYFLIGTLTSLIFLFIPLLAFVYLQELPNPRELSARQIPQTTKIYDRNGILLYQIYATQNRTIVPLSSIPLSLQHATLAIEDKNFYHHPGFDVVSMVRAFWSNTSGGSFQGGSTITQQLIKSAMLTPEPSYIRKIKEVILAFWAERIYNKQQILEMYFNQVPYGGTAWGVEAASEVYFGKSVKDLDLAESAFLAGITSAPTSYSPYGPDPSLWKKRQAEVLGHMVELQYISKAQAEKARRESLVFRSPTIAIKAPHFVEYIRDLLIRRYGLAMVEKGGLNVRTSLDMSIQDKAQKIVADQVAQAGYLNLTNGAALVTDPRNGDIIAMVGSKDYYDEQYGHVNVTTSLRQPGSSIKVVTYSAALTKGFTAASILQDTPVTYTFAGAEPYSPVNYDGKFRGPVPFRLALANSLNIPAVKLLNQIGIPTMVNLAKQMGITTWDDPSKYGLSITLGGAEVKMVDMAVVFGTLANSGERVDLNPILKITDGKGNVLEEKGPVDGTRVLDKGVAFIISNILQDNAARSIEFGSNSPLNIPGHTVSVKTGTTDYKRDNWTFGYTNNWLVGVCVGNNDNTPMSQTLASGITGAAPIWNGIMNELLKVHAEAQPVVPDTIVQKNCFGRTEYFIKGTETSIPCNFVTPSPQQGFPGNFFRRFEFRR